MVSMTVMKQSRKFVLISSYLTSLVMTHNTDKSFLVTLRLTWKTELILLQQQQQNQSLHFGP